MFVTVCIQPETALSLHRPQQATHASEELLQATHRLGVSLEPLYPGAEIPALLPYFMVDVPNIETAQKVIDTLQGCQAIEAVYLKPQGEAPSFS